jgi:histone H3/H4
MAKKAKKKAKMEMLLVGSKVKGGLRGMGVNVGEGTLEALNGMLLWYMEQAAKRAKSNGRKTVRPHDVMIP